MGLIRAAAGAVSGTLADSWLEYITAGDMGANTVLTRGVQIKRGKHGSNTKGTPDIISNGSRIEVGPNQMMILVDSGRIVDYTAEEGCYEVFLSSSPSMFNGELKDSVRESFERFKFGGQPGKSQQVYFINLQEIRGIKFGTRNALQYFDNFYNAELFVRCHGSYSVKITDPLKFYMEVVPRNASNLTFDALGDQFNMEFLTALQSAIGQMSVDGVRISALPSKSMELSKYMATVLDEDWTQARGMDICAVGIASISYDDESKALINMRNQGAMMGDPSVGCGKGFAVCRLEPCRRRASVHVNGHGNAGRRQLYGKRICHQRTADAAAGSGTGCSGKRLDLYLRHSQQRQLLHQLRRQKACACRHLEVQLRRREHRQFLHQLRQQETGAVRRMEVQLRHREYR